MGLIFLFRKLVFAQVLLGIVAFCMAERSPENLLIAGAVAALSWYVSEGPSGRPLPRWLINLGAMGTVLWLVVDLMRNEGDVIRAMGHFTMWLQILMLYAEKTNREYGQVMVLSLMQMIGASILPGGQTMFFGVLLLSYSVLVLFTVLMFQLKLASDQVVELNRVAAPAGVRVSRPRPVVGRGHRWQFRALAIVIGLGCAAVAVVVFIVMPRTSRYGQGGEGMTNPLTSKQTGFSAQVRLDGQAPMIDNREPILTLTVKQGGASVGGEARSWLLRGAALDAYNSNSRTWVRDLGTAHDSTLPMLPQGVTLARVPEHVPVIDAYITQRTASDRMLFTMQPVTFVSSTNLDSVVFNPQDQQLMAGATFSGGVLYHLQAPVVTPPGVYSHYWQVTARHAIRMTMGEPFAMPPALPPDPAVYARQWTVEVARIRALAQSILRQAGLPERDPESLSTLSDLDSARAFEQYLGEHFSYALRNVALAPGEDPIVEFLFNHKEGHCEVFAAGLAALARSVGMQARVITGYRASEYNRLGGYYVVRQSHAHAWCEINCGEAGWQTFDATPPAPAAGPSRSILASFRELYEHLEWIWIRTVVTYDRETRKQVISSIDRSIRDKASSPDNWLGKAVQWVKEVPQRWEFDRFSYTLIIVILFFILVGLASLVHTIVVRRRRLAALQLYVLPRAERRNLAKRLRFYLTMLDMLERQGLVRPSWQSPALFAQELAEDDPLRFDPVVSLTEQFYEIRFGHRQLDPTRKKSIDAHLNQLQANLLQRGKPKLTT